MNITTQYLLYNYYLIIVEQIIMREQDKIVTKSLYVTYKLLCLLCRVIQYYFSF